jgi:N-acetylglucosamine kinase-like BadF-type ATPase
MGTSLKIIADSGSTKTDWFIGRSATEGTHLASPGLNPFFHTENDILHTVEETFAAVLTDSPDNVEEIYFYGSGCTPEMAPVVRNALARKFTRADIHVESDLLGAARALCGHEEGIACILGTGSNSCHFDGEAIVSQVSPLGFILGDEGSGAVLGRRLIGDVLKEQLPASVSEDFMQTYGLTRANILYNVYKQPNPNRFLAGFAPFLAKHRAVEEVHALLVSAFGDFFRRNVRKYPYPRLSAHLVGSIAHHFRPEIEEAARQEGIRLGRTLKSPIEGLIRYYFAR